VEKSEPNDEPPQSDFASSELASDRSADSRYFSHWMREQLIQHFQESAGFSRDEARRQIEAYERRFMAAFGGGPARSEPWTDASEDFHAPKLEPGPPM
jgi:hypothetical protein